MNATKRSVAGVGLVLCAGLAVAVTGCRTRVIEHTRTVYVPAPVVAPAPQPPQVVYVPPAPAPQPPPPVVVVPPQEQAPEEAPVVVIQSENDFYEPLATYGRWVVIGSYGRCWVPGRVEVGWRPYSNGYWQRTDAGWYWASDEPWGWATYHYGRWDFNPQYGWVWVPQTQWAPAWVSWREGGGYVGWAPLRPSAQISVNVHIGDDEPAFASRAFVFVEHRRLLEPVRPKTVVVNNTTIIKNTVNITKVTIVNKTVVNEGPLPDVIERESGRKVKAVPVREFRHKEEVTVVARDRNIPTSRERKTEPPARIEYQPAEKTIIPPPAVHHDERPTMTYPQPSISKPLTPPVSPRPATGKPERDEKKLDTDNARQVGTVPPIIKPETKPTKAIPVRQNTPLLDKTTKPAKPAAPARDEKKPEPGQVRQGETTLPTVKPEAKPTKAIPPHPDVSSREKPALVTNPMTYPAPTESIRDEKKSETVVEKKDKVTPPPIELKQGNNVSPDTRREMKLPAKLDSAPLAPKKQVAPSEKPANKRLLSPRERDAGQTGNKEKKQETGNAKQKGEDHEAPPVDPTDRPH